MLYSGTQDSYGDEAGRRQEDEETRSREAKQPTREHEETRKPGSKETRRREEVGKKGSSEKGGKRTKRQGFKQCEQQVVSYLIKMGYTSRHLTPPGKIKHGFGRWGDIYTYIYMGGTCSENGVYMS